MPARAVRPGAGGDPRALAAVPAGGGGDRLRGEPAYTEGALVAPVAAVRGGGTTGRRCRADAPCPWSGAGRRPPPGIRRAAHLARRLAGAGRGRGQGAGFAACRCRLPAGRGQLPVLAGRALVARRQRRRTPGLRQRGLAGTARQLPAAAAGLRRAGGGAPGGGGSPGPGGQSARLAERAAAGHRPGPGRVRRAPAEQPVAPLAAAAGVGRAVVGIAMGLHPGPGLAVAARRRPLRGAERRTLPPVVSRGPQADQPARAVRPAPGRQRQQRRRGPVARPAWPGRHGDRRRADGERRATGLQRRSRRRRPPGAGSRFRRAGTAAFASQRVRAGGAAGFGQPRWLDGQRAPGDRRWR